MGRTSSTHPGSQTDPPAGGAARRPPRQRRPHVPQTANFHGELRRPTPALTEALIDLIADSTISGRLAKEVFAEMIATGADPAAIVEAKGLRQVTDTRAIEAAVDEVLAAHVDKVAEYRAGRDKLYGFFVGQIMRATQGKANPALVNRLLKEKLSG